jgi:hypothetical protein
MLLRNQLRHLWAFIPGKKAILARLRLSKSAPKGKQPDEVFTPRSERVNPAMYVGRPELERFLRNGLESGFHIVIRGRSGHGKSWLYQKYLEDRQIYFDTCNLATAARLGSISKEFSSFLARAGVSIHSEKKIAGNLAAGSLGVSAEESKTFFEPDLFELVLAECRKQAGERSAVLILDNLEGITQEPNLLKELANLIVLLDDRNYARYNVRLIIVGATENIIKYYASEPNLPTISNRIRELPEVSSLTEEQCHTLSMQGLVTELDLRLPPDIQAQVLDHISIVTARVPQKIHEYCLELARLAEENDRAISMDLVKKADQYYSEYAGLHIEPEEPKPTQFSKAAPQTSTPKRQPLEQQPQERPEHKAPPARLALGRFFRMLGWMAGSLLAVAAILYSLLYVYFRFVF